MRPQFSIIFFTTLAGMAQGLLFSLSLICISQPFLPIEFLVNLALPISFGLLVLGLIASFFHLGHPERAWRAAAMWRTSWLSREVIFLPALMAITFLIYVFAWNGVLSPWLWITLLFFTVMLWVCTAKIYQCIRFIQEWSHPSTMFNFILLGITSGWILLELLLYFWNESFDATYGLFISGIGIVLLCLSFTLKLWIWNRNKGLKPKSNLASATGIKGENIRQTSMGFMGGSFNTREFFHHQTESVINNIRKIILFGTYIAPFILILSTLILPNILAIALALLIHYTGLLAERWMFFAEANHPQNLYYQRVS